MVILEVGGITFRLAGTEKRLMERLAQEKTARDVEATAARRRIKNLEEELRAARKLLDEQSAAALQLQASVGSELDGLRKLLVRHTSARASRQSKVSPASPHKKPRSGNRGRGGR